LKPKSEQKNAPTPRLRLHPTAKAESAIRSGHPWLFADSIREQNRPGQMGELAAIFDGRDEFLAMGLFDPESPIRARILHAGRPEVIDREWWRRRLEQAIAARRKQFGKDTTGHRWINGESDGWPGLVLDQYGPTLVLKLYTAGWLARLDEITGLIEAALPNERIVLRLSRNIKETVAGLGRSDGEILRGAPMTGPVIFSETGLSFEADVLRGQKTGFFLDQRENRRKVESLAAGRAVLNAFSFSGGFSIYAARGGASAVLDLDISGHALESAKRNFALNKSIADITQCPREAVQADAFEWLAESTRRFDLIVLDPPSLARREAERGLAVRAYGRLVTLGINRLAPGGILVAASCSAHVTAEEFFGAVRHSAARSGRQFIELGTTRHPADHPATFPEAEYLKAIYLQFSQSSAKR
jgi:23S rRNA (cytosine1962-C5)-methyltransferase